jgi:hypothetical protein
VKPLLLMDVDGPLNPFDARWFVSRTPRDGYSFHQLKPAGGQTYWVALNPTHGRRLEELSAVYDLAWATTWGEDANRLIAPIVGLPTDLPVVPLLQPRFRIPGVFWKTEQIAEWVGPRPFAWFDDEINRATRDWLADQSGLGAHHTRRVAANEGLKSADFAALEEFAITL